MKGLGPTATMETFWPFGIACLELCLVQGDVENIRYGVDVLPEEGGKDLAYQFMLTFDLSIKLEGERSFASK